MLAVIVSTDVWRTEMSVWEFLRSIPKTVVLIERKTVQVQEMESSLIYKGIQNTEGSFGSTDVESRNNALAEWVALKNELEKDIIKLVESKRKAMNMIGSLSEARKVDIFYRRYMENMRWEEIALSLGVTYQWVHELHKQGLRELAKKWPEFDSVYPKGGN